MHFAMYNLNTVRLLFWRLFHYEKDSKNKKEDKKF